MGDQSILQALMKELGQLSGERSKHDLPSGYSVSTNYPHGEGGIFGVFGLDRDIFSTRVVPDGLMRYLPATGVNNTHPIVGYLTGFTAGSGDEPEASCDTPPRAGQMKSCFQGSAFGRVSRSTEVIDLSEVGDVMNDAEFLNLNLVNDPLLSDPSLLVPGSIPKSMQGALASEVLGKWVALGVEFEDVLSKMIYTGNPANNTSGGYAEYLGLEGLITTTHTDVLTGANCPSLASTIMDFNYQNVSTAAATLFYWMTAMWRHVQNMARRMNMMPVQWAFVMQDALFHELTDYWPCVYGAFRCSATANDVSNNVDAMAMREMSDMMYQGQYLTIDGVRVPVITDDAIPQEYNGDDARVPNTGFASDIYLLPFTVKGGRRVLYFEFFDFNGPNAAMAEAIRGNIGNFFWSDAGRFLWYFQQTRTCVDWTAIVKPRLRLLVPHLAGRIQHVVAQPLIMPRGAFNDNPYWVDGGNTSTSGLAPYSTGALY